MKKKYYISVKDKNGNYTKRSIKSYEPGGTGGFSNIFKNLNQTMFNKFDPKLLGSAIPGAAEDEDEDEEETKPKNQFNAGMGLANSMNTLGQLQQEDGKLDGADIGQSAGDFISGGSQYGQIGKLTGNIATGIIGQNNTTNTLGEGVEYQKTGITAMNKALEYGATGAQYFGPLGCVCKGTKIITNEGKFVNIEDLKKEDGVIGFNGDNYITQEIIEFHPPAQKECLRIKTKLGYTLECSTDHPIYATLKGRAPRFTIEGKRTRLKQYGYLDANQLTVGDKVGIINEIPIWGTEVMDRAYIVGMCIGDGTYGKGKGVRLVSADIDTWNYLENNNLGRLNNSIREATETTKELRTYTIINGTTLFKKLGIYEQTKLNKRLPVEIHKYDKDSICKLLAGLFDTDGYVTFNSLKPNNSMIAFCQSNMILIEEIRQQLGKLGIHGYIKTTKACKTIINKREVSSKEAYQLIIKDKHSVINFYNNISLNISYKKENLKNFYEYKTKGLTTDHRNITNVCSDTIKSIINIGMQDIYNLEAGDSHTYIANMIITHNSAVGTIIGGAMGLIQGNKRKKAAMEEFTKRRAERINNFNQQSELQYDDQYRNQKFYAKNGGKNSINIKPDNVGKFTVWCKNQGFNSVTTECIDKGIKSKSAITRKRAVFAKNTREFNK